ncbi:MAG TPA: RHS repeat-associated core domain-containing protein [Chthoniobacterales bacterium]
MLRSLRFRSSRSPLWHRLVSAILLPACLASWLPLYSLAETDAAGSLPLASPPVTNPDVADTAPTEVEVNTAVPDVPTARQQPLAFSEQPADAEFATVRLFSEPLIAFDNDSSDAESDKTAENATLAKALVAFEAQLPGDDASGLEEFLAAYPDSRWSVSLLTNLGIFYRQHGYWTRALSSWQLAWEKGQGETSPSRRMIVDRAVVQLTELKARLGRIDEVESLVQEVGDRDIQGAMTEKWSGVKTSLSLMKTEPSTSFRCGPFAVGSVAEASNLATLKATRSIEELLSTTDGTSMRQLKELAETVGLDYQIAFRSPGSQVIVPCVIHWKAGHYAALTKEMDGRFFVKDPTFSDDFVISRKAVDDEASGYFLVPAGGLPEGWKTVSVEEGAKVWGKGAVPPASPPTPPGTGPTIGCPKPPKSKGMAVYNMDPSRVNLMIWDTPLFYTPPRGPEVAFTASYSQRDVAPSSVPNYPNLGSKWSFNWVSFILDDPSNATTSSYGPGGGSLKYYSYSGGASQGSFIAQEITQTVLSRTSAVSYEKKLPDGTRQVFGLADNSSPKRIFLTESYDPAGNKTTYTYDPTTVRLLAVTDPLGQVTTLFYLSNSATLPNSSPNPDFYKVNKATDPFGRFATFTYNAAGQLWKITDTAGIVSEFTYGTGDFIKTLTTPYGSTQFVSTEVHSTRSLLVTDPMGGKEYLEMNFSTTPPDAGAPTPAGMQMVTNGSKYNSGYWDKKAYAGVVADYAKAQITNWLVTAEGAAVSDIPASTKNSLENRVYYNYAGQTNPDRVGSNNKPVKIGRVLDDGSTELAQVEYNSSGKVTKMVTPGNATTPSRTTTYQYAANGIDLLAVYQQNAAGLSTDPFGAVSNLLASFTYDTGGKHLVLSAKDASRRTTSYTYNGYGQVLTVTNAKNEVTTFTYDRDQDSDGKTDGYLISITGPVVGATTQFQYDGFGRLWKVTDSEGYTIETLYDAIGGVATKTLNRPVKIKYPDGTDEQVVYDKLDAQFTKDRLDRWTQIIHDRLRHPVAVIDPSNRITQYDWCPCGSLEAIVDPAGNRTSWVRDVQGREVYKIYPDKTQVAYQYENATGRLKSATDAKGQRTNYQYFIDGSLKQVSYTDASGNALVPATPGVAFTYEPVYGRLATMTDGIGTTTNAYNPVPNATTQSLGAGRLATVDGPWASDTIGYGYDELGRIKTRQIDGAANSTSYGYDTLGRIATVTNSLGAFIYSYLRQTGLVANVIYPNGQTTTYDYFNNTGDQRLKQIKNLTSASAIISQFDHTYAATGRMDTWTQNNSGLSAAKRYQFGYDLADQLTSAGLSNVSTGANLGEQAWRYDRAGNRVTNQDGNAVTSYTANNLNQFTASNGGGMMRFAGTVNEPATVTVGGNPASVDAANRYEGYAQVDAGTMTRVHIVATDKEGNVTDKYVDVTHATIPAKVYNYDLNGSLLNYGPSGTPEVTYTYDAANRLASVTKGADIYSYEYDGMNRRVREKLNGAETKRWVWDGLEIAEHRNASNQIAKRYFPQGFTLNTQSPTLNLFYARDHLGGIREVTDSAQAVRGRYDYDPYGVRSANLITANPIESDFGYTGHYYDASTGLHAAPFRFYNASLGRWINRDPIRENGGINLYGYVQNNPINYYDLKGLNPLAIPLVLGIPIGEAIGAALVAGIVGELIDDYFFPNEIADDDDDDIPPPRKPELKPKPKPKGCPAGTRPVNEAGDRAGGSPHEIKDWADQGPRDWTGIDPEGNVWVDDGSGNGLNLGPYPGPGAGTH